MGQIKQQQHETCPIMWTVVGRSRDERTSAEEDNNNSGREEVEMDVARIRPLMKILRQVIHADFYESTYNNQSMFYHLTWTLKRPGFNVNCRWLAGKLCC